MVSKKTTILSKTTVLSSTKTSTKITRKSVGKTPPASYVAKRHAHRLKNYDPKHVFRAYSLNDRVIKQCSYRGGYSRISASGIQAIRNYLKSEVWSIGRLIAYLCENSGRAIVRTEDVVAALSIGERAHMIPDKYSHYLEKKNKKRATLPAIEAAPV